jgi:glutaredoxin
MGRSTRIAVSIAAASVVLAGLAAAQSTVYRWTDKDGKVHFSDVPPPEAKDLTQKRVGDTAPDTALPYATQVATQRNPVTLYVKDQCKPCDDGRALLSRRGIPYTERNAQGNAAEVEAVKKLAGTPEVPLLLVGATQLKGYSEDAWMSALDAAGYPPSLPPGMAAPPPVRVGAPARPTGESAASPKAQ